MKLPRYTAKVPPSREAGAARAGDITSLTQTGEAAKLQALRGVGKAIGGVSETLYKRQVIDDQIEYGSATQRTEEQANQGIAAADILDVTMDMPLPDDPKYLETLTSFSTVKRDGLIVDSLEEYDSSVAKIAQGISNPRNRDKFITWSGARRVVYKEELRKKYTRKLHDYQESKLNEFRLSAARNGDVEAADQWADIMDKRELITPEAARILKEDNRKVVASSGAKAILEAGIETGLDPFKMMDEAFKFIDTVKGLNVDDRLEIKKDIEREANLRAFWGDVAQIANRDEELTKGYEIIEEPATATYEQIDALNLGEGDKETMKNLLAGAVENPAPKTSHQVYNKLIGDILDEADRTITLGDLLKNMRAERFENFTLSQEDYDDLASKMRLNLPAAIVKSLKDAKLYGEQSIPAVLRGKKEDAKRIAGYNRAMLDWIIKNTDKDGFQLNVDDIYIQSRVLASVFKSADEITPETGKKVKRIPGGINEIEVITPDGTRGFIPEGQLEEAIKQGYKKVE